MGEHVRIIDRIDTAPRYMEGDAVRLNNMFRGRDTVEMLTVLLKENMLGDAAIVSSFAFGWKLYTLVTSRPKLPRPSCVLSLSAKAGNIWVGNCDASAEGKPSWVMSYPNPS